MTELKGCKAEIKKLRTLHSDAIKQMQDMFQDGYKHGKKDGKKDGLILAAEIVEFYKINELVDSIKQAILKEAENE